MGILSFSDIKLLNLEKRFKNILDPAQNPVRVEFECNSVHLRSDPAERRALAKPAGDPEEYTRDQYCLYPRNNSTEDFFSEGRRYFMSNRRRAKNASPLSWLEWGSQFNFFINSPHNTVDIKLVMDIKDSQSGRLEPNVIGRQSIPVAELSMYLDEAQVGHENNFAVEFSYLSVGKGRKTLEEHPDIASLDYNITYSHDTNLEADE